MSRSYGKFAQTINKLKNEKKKSDSLEIVMVGSDFFQNAKFCLILIIYTVSPRSVGFLRAARATSQETKRFDYHFCVTNSLTFTLSLSWLL